MNRKGKGTLGENELIHNFWKTGNWVAVRVAGSGSSRFPSPDILASRGDRKLVLEVKVINATKKYFTSEQINELNFFANKFGAESWVGIKFKEGQWFFIPTSELNETESKNFSISLIEMKKRGFTFDEMINF